MTHYQNKPDNVMISSWLPQRDILAHPNVKAYICHGGLLGTTEAVYEGVPVLGIPIFGDQKTNHGLKQLLVAMDCKFISKMFLKKQLVLPWKNY
ncbi:hypothetical protein PVAND_000879 [Polypedilum vanderplanki]|uniref:UDP-glucuronosyltransferase n=1 Tax=Polypedilum vanderplanki TaxID=319348 RepID=A0A9J6BLV8_POLVA|nr:hypothetical protein PVAND_000879 [Polypedilum vanderplanki]